ncbi:MAG: valine--tRNA ligase [Candidatus Woesearchaeota archaeon]
MTNYLNNSFEKLTDRNFDKHYVFQEYEPLIEAYWQKYDFYSKQFEEFLKKVKSGKIALEVAKEMLYTIDTPPPTVNADGMHIGHAFSYSQIDFFARFFRMRGKIVYFPFGYDDNGLPTERYVEKKIGKRADEMRRDEFRNECYKIINEIEDKIREFWLRMGLSADFKDAYSTISAKVIKISQLSFVELYEMGRIYRKDSPIQWCPECKTAISQTETKDMELETYLNYVVFKLVDEHGKEIEDLIIATTRPELLPACVAVFIHPSDERLNRYLNKKAKVPLFDYTVPILTDERVDPAFGSGVVMCCTFGDVTDIEWFKIHNLPLKEVIDEKGRMNKLAGKYEGLTIKEARIKIIEDLKNAGLLIDQKRMVHVVNVHERCNTPIEFLSRPQWFIKYLDLKDKFLELGKQLKWYPETMINRYNNWVNGLKWDWCISRQRFFGVPIPVWYCEKGHVVVADKEELPVDPVVTQKRCPICGSKCKPEEDVLDTWATSSLTPFIISKWKEDELFFKLTFPNSLRPQAHDIISFWLFTTIVKSYLHEKQLPWKNAAISGYVLAADGSKMSKSKGNVVNPWDVITEYGSDVLRFWAASSKLGEDLPIEEKEFINGKRFVDKLWNASRFVSMNVTDAVKEIQINQVKFFLNRWLLTKFSKSLIKATLAMEENYDYSKIKMLAEKFFRIVYCDNYLELVKFIIRDHADPGLVEETKFVMKRALLDTLKMLSPIMPHITELIYHKVFDPDLNNSIHLSKWPEPILVDEINELLGDAFVYVVSATRKYRAVNQKKYLDKIAKIDIFLDEKLEHHRESFEHELNFLRVVCNAENVSLKSGKEFKVMIEDSEVMDVEYKVDF